jgi:hypothetical protein
MEVVKDDDDVEEQQEKSGDEDTDVLAESTVDLKNKE